MTPLREALRYNRGYTADGRLVAFMPGPDKLPRPKGTCPGCGSTYLLRCHLSWICWHCRQERTR